MKIIIALILLAAGCSTPNSPPPSPLPPAPISEWIPEIGDLVTTSYCAECPAHTSAEPYQTWLTDTYQDPTTGTWTVWADGWPEGGISVSLVKPVWPHDPPPFQRYERPTSNP